MLDFPTFAVRVKEGKLVIVSNNYDIWNYKDLFIPV